MTEVRTQLEKIIKSMSGQPYASELEDARKEYFAITGEVHDDDPSCEVRMILFIEWFVLERPLARGVIPVRAYIEEKGEALTPSERDLTEALLHQQHGLFRIKRSKAPTLSLKDLWSGKTIRVEAGEVARSFQAGDLIDARLVRFQGKTWLTEGVLCHPPVAESYIKKEIKALKKAGAEGPGEFCLRLAGMLHKYEQYRFIKPENIYRTG